MKFWLIKSEPDVWSLSQQRKAGSKGVAWDGVRNYQAANNLKAMKFGDLCFFYHSNIGKEIVGVVKVIKEAFIDKTDKEKRFVAVQVRFIEQFNSPISLEISACNTSRLISLKISYNISFNLRTPGSYVYDSIIYTIISSLNLTNGLSPSFL